MKQLLILAVLFAIASAFTEVEYQNEFTNWMRKLTKAYTSKDFQGRYNIFKTNLDFITRWNEEHTGTVLGENELADLSNDEYRRFYLGYRPSQSERLRATGWSWEWPTAAPTSSSSSGSATGWTWPTPAPTNKPTAAPTAAPTTRPTAAPTARPTTRPTTTPTTRPTTAPTAAPTTAPNAPGSLNWASLGAVTPVKNQGQCGSCWSFSATGAVEGAYFIKTGKLVSLSEQNLIECSTQNHGCSGGSMGLAFKHIITAGGVQTGATYPYKGTDTEACKFNTANIGATISSYKNVASGSESALLTAVNLGPVSVAIDASRQSFQLYKTGVYYEPSCSSTALDHGVLLVGYGTSGSSDYWIVKNSWGAGWGQGGYIWMSRNKNNNCGIATSAVYPVV